MDRVAVFVDAGYLFAQGSVALCGEKLARGEIVLDHRAVIVKLKSFAESQAKLDLLRIYWYDGTAQGPTPQHITLAEQAGVKVRLGFVNSVGQQKGVDSLIVTDMITLARNRAVAECVLLSGDEDLRVGVQLAQEYGVRVHLLGIKPARGSQSLFLIQEADATYEWDASDLGQFLKCIPRRAPVPDSGERVLPGLEESSDAAGPWDRVARVIAADVPAGEVAALADSILRTNSRPREIDAQLLARSRGEVGRDLNPPEKAMVRDAFLRALEARLEEPPSDDKRVTDPSAGTP